MIYSDTTTQTEREPFEWLNDLSREFLKRGYLSEGEVAEERIITMANHAEKLLGIKGFADKFTDYMSRGWYSLSSPIWANFGKERGLPVSCFGSMIEDNIESILYTQSEVGEMSKMGGGQWKSSGSSTFHEFV
jgi:ribonucleoside-diphosphate reductase alpha chain